MYPLFPDICIKLRIFTVLENPSKKNKELYWCSIFLLLVILLSMLQNYGNFVYPFFYDAICLFVIGHQHHVSAHQCFVNLCGTHCLYVVGCVTGRQRFWREGSVTRYLLCEAEF